MTGKHTITTCVTYDCASCISSFKIQRRITLVRNAVIDTLSKTQWKSWIYWKKN